MKLRSVRDCRKKQQDPLLSYYQNHGRFKMWYVYSSDMGSISKNAPQNVDSHFPNQIVFDMNVNLPSILTEEDPAFQFDLIRKKIVAMHSGR